MEGFADFRAYNAKNILYQDAMSVARETIRRVRHNLDLLLPRLIGCGFVFGYDYRLSSFFNSPFPGNMYEENGYLYALDFAKKNPPVFLSGNLAQRNQAEQTRFVQHDNFQETSESENYEDPLVPDMQKYIQAIEIEIGVLPLSIKAWYEQIGGVNLYGFHPSWAQWYCEHVSLRKDRYYFLMSHCDPLFIASLTSNWKNSIFSIQPESNEEMTSIFQFAPDCANKDLFSGSPSPYVIAIPNPFVDAPLLFLDDYLTPEGETLTFVQYLRFCFAWAGFPKMSRWSDFPREDIARLTKDFLPF